MSHWANWPLPSRVNFVSELVRHMPARELRHKMAEGKLTVVAVTEACLAAIRAREPIIQAWEWLDEKGALDAAAALDAKRDQGAPLGPSFGLPIGVKDVIDT